MAALSGNQSVSTQARIQDFEMGGEFSSPQSEKSEKSEILIFEDKKKERKKGAQKKGGENSPISPPLDPRLSRLSLTPAHIQFSSKYSLHVRLEFIISTQKDSPKV